MKKIIALSAAFLIAACGSILPKGPPAPTLYTLNPVAMETNGDAASVIPVSLRILMPQAAPGLETQKIVLRKENNQIDYFAGIEWTGTLGALIQHELVESFDGTKQLASVSNDLVPITQNYSLLIEIQDFQIGYDKSTPVGHVRLTAKLIDVAQNKILTTTTYAEDETARANTAQAVVLALDTAFQRASAKIVTDTLQTLRQTVIKKPVKKSK